MNEITFTQLPWYVYEDTAYHASAKAGSQSLLAYLLMLSGNDDKEFGRRRGYIHANQDILEIYATHEPTARRRIQYVRDPWDRFISFYSDKVFNCGDNTPAELRGATLLDTIYYVKNHLYENIHWCPQHMVSSRANIIKPLSSMDGKTHTGDDLALKTTKQAWHALPDRVKYTWRHMYLADMILYDYATGDREE